MTLRSTLSMLLVAAAIAAAALRSASANVLPAAGAVPSQWEAATMSGEPATGLPARLRDLDILPSGRGLAVANGPRLWQTVDAGRTWTLLQPRLAGAPRNWAAWSVTHGEDGVALLSLASGEIFRSEDGGVTWSETRDAAPGHGIGDVAFVDEEVVVAVGAETILRSTDGGLTWSERPVPPFSYQSVAFGSPSVGLAVGGAGIALRTTDGGATWERVELDTWEAVRGVAFADARTAVIVGSSGTILRSADAGESWTRISAPSRQHLRGVDFGDARTGLAVGLYGTILRTDDGGLTWREEASGTLAHLNDARVAEDGTAFAFGWLETILVRRAPPAGGGTR